ncbi:MAG TPA: sigma-70 family RNA polymerase sigma factor [Bryobacteraceae bacterium]|jgi:RNA polymerase sigma-70 factor (ECF subfamily)|nr:sigma-70 family RNA polymerase sigma factor [Bryobacteraceae bacterium]
MVLESNDRETIAACQRGDRDAFRALFEAYQDRVYSIALRYTADPAAALDIAQETFLKLLSSIREFRGDSNFDTWLYRLVVNRCFDYRRGGKRWLAFVEELLDRLREPQASVLEELARGEVREEVRKGVAQLPPEQRMAVVLRYTEGLAYEQIAEIMGCSPGTVASRLNRAHKTLERGLSHLRGRR